MSKRFNFDPSSYAGLDKLGRIPLSSSFHLREFLYSEIGTYYRLQNVPDDIYKAVDAGRQLCQLLLEPLQEKFGRIHIRSGYRSRGVNQRGMSKAQGGEGHNCAADNDGDHTWDYPSTSGHGAGAMACISVPSISRQVLSGEVDVSAIAWWIHDHLPAWSVIEFFATPADIQFADEVTFNLGWHETPKRLITTWRGGPRNLHGNIPSAEVRSLSWQRLHGMKLT